MKPPFSIIFATCSIGLYSNITAADLTIAPGEYYENNEFLVNENSIVNLGTFDNRLHVYNNASSRFDNAGYLQNTGTFTISPLAVLVNDGSVDNLNIIDIHNDGSLINSSSGVFTNYDFSQINNSNIIINDGLFYSDGTLDNRDGAGIINAGTFSGNARFGSGGYFENSGTLNINNFEFTDNNVLTSSGVINNASTFLYLGFRSRIENTGEFINSGQIFSGGDSELNTAGMLRNTDLGSIEVTLNNSGVVENNGYIKGVSSFPSGISIINTAAGVLNNKGADYTAGTAEGRISVEGEMVNHGVINNAGLINDDYSSAKILNTGVINNSEAGRINTSGLIENSGELNNYSEIDVSEVQSSGVIKNHGIISAYNGVTVSDGGRLSGSGAVVTSKVFAGTGGVIIEEGGVLAPEVSDILLPYGEGTISTMTIAGDVTLNGIFEVDLNYFENDFLKVFGDLILGDSSILDINFDGLDSFPIFGPLDLARADTIYGDFSNNDFFYNGERYSWEIIDGAYEDILRLDVAAVPVPASVWLFLSGGFCLVGVVRRKSTRK